MRARKAWASLLSGGALLGAPAGVLGATLEEHLLLCGACHGPTGNSTIAENPVLAGADADYLSRQLADFKSGRRSSPVMNQIMLTLDPDSLQGVVEFFANQKREALPAADEVPIDAGQAARGRIIFEEGVVASAVPDCASCHGSDGIGDAKYPRLAGQHAVYVVNQLKAFKSGERANDLKGVMSAVARRLAEDEISAVAQFVSTLKEE